jgi:hypothetical protein
MKRQPCHSLLILLIALDKYIGGNSIGFENSLLYNQCTFHNSYQRIIIKKVVVVLIAQ